MHFVDNRTDSLYAILFANIDVAPPPKHRPYLTKRYGRKTIIIVL